MLINTNSHKMKRLRNRSRSLLFLFCFMAILLPLIVFILNFKNHIISNNIDDWADFGTFVGSTIQVILSVINIYIFYMLTEMAAKINQNNMGKQLVQNTFRLYQNSINQVSMDFLSCLEQYNIRSIEPEQIGMERIRNRLAWMRAITNSFLIETKPILRDDDYKNIELSCNKLNDAIDELLNSNLEDVTELENYLISKSLFLESVNQIIYSYYDE